nr:unnamed protein product [Spirometra erinaceieuropaei]
MLSNRRGPDWSYCLRCESVRPPRAHHCRRCDVCILRFDHHCTFLGQCVGYRNIASFLHLLVYSSIICLFSTCFNLPYFVNVLTPDWRIWQRAICLINPLPFFLLGWFSFANFLLSILMSACLVLGPAFAIFFVHHFLQVCRNQTTIEISIASPTKVITAICHEDELRPIEYDIGRAANLEQVPYSALRHSLIEGISHVGRARTLNYPGDSGQNGRVIFTSTFNMDEEIVAIYDSDAA